MLYLLGPLLLIATVVDSVRAETHTIHFINNCGFGTPTLVQGSNVLSTGGTNLNFGNARTCIEYDPHLDFTTNGLIDAIAYLQTGETIY
ncbi:hypothetical protein C8R44DRAFT_884914 [Mycena epipterygia]|nr:hypothetical protein C8R44DRAFT_884914 [Mycena epipterygia]